MPNFEIRKVQKGSDLLVRTPVLGAALAKTLGKKPVALMRGHGSVVVGESLPRAVGRTIYLDISARIQMQAIFLAGAKGKITYIDDAEMKANAPIQDYLRAWPLWKDKALEQIRSDKQKRK